MKSNERISIEPPDHLSDESKELWQIVDQLYLLTHSGYKVLQLAVESYDRAQQARAHLDANGLTFNDRFDQPKPRPEVKIEHDSRALCSKLLADVLRHVTGGVEYDPLAMLEADHDPLHKILADRKEWSNGRQ